jgi:hypothetical protein
VHVNGDWNTGEFIIQLTRANQLTWQVVGPVHAVPRRNASYFIPVEEKKQGIYLHTVPSASGPVRVRSWSRTKS